ncbi:MAG: hypothetical protein WDW38_001307 [Sanguina aurantia]
MTSLSKHRTCPQASSSSSHTPTHEHPVISAVAVEEDHQPTSTSSSSIQSRSLGVLGTGLAGWVLQSQFAALADVTAETTLAEQDVTSVLVALDGGSQQTNDLLISIAFTLVVAALSVVTLGVAYLSFSTWNDGRLESEDVQAAKSSIKFPNAAATSKKESDDELVSLRRSSKIKKDKNKGFGGNPFSD